MKLPLALLLILAAPAMSAERPLRLAGGPKAEDALRKFVSENPAFKAKINDAVSREVAFLAESRDSDLHDSVADAAAADQLRTQLAKTAGPGRADLLRQLPGLKAPIASACRSISDCPHPDLALDVSSPDELADAVRGLVRPWMLLQAARGSEILLSPATGEGDAVLTVKLKGVDVSPLTLNVSPRLLGGFEVWFDQPLVLAALYGRERDAALKSTR